MIASLRFGGERSSSPFLALAGCGEFVGRSMQMGVSFCGGGGFSSPSGFWAIACEEFSLGVVGVKARRVMELGEGVASGVLGGEREGLSGGGELSNCTGTGGALGEAGSRRSAEDVLFGEGVSVYTSWIGYSEAEDVRSWALGESVGEMPESVG